MCRWFAYISPTEPCLLEDVLINPKHSLSKQVHDHYLPKLVPHNPESIGKDRLIAARNALYNIDGLGIAWYTSSNADFERGNTGESSDGVLREGLRPAVYKTIQPPLRDMNFRSICANIETRVCFAHIRAASGTAIAAVNNHPFVFGRHTFMHNGMVSDFVKIQRQLCTKLSDAAFANISGSTDSEHIAALYMTHLTKRGDLASFEKEYTAEAMADAMNRAVADIIELQISILGSDKRPNSLNLCATDGVQLIAYRFRNHATQEPPSLYYSTKAGTTLNRKYPDNADGIEIPGRVALKAIEEHGKHVIVASEPSTHAESDWELIGKNQVVSVDPGGVKIDDIPYDKAWDAEEEASK